MRAKPTTAREQRVEIVNQIIDEIAKRGRRFLYSNTKDRTAKFVLINNRPYFVDHYTGQQVYPYGNKKSGFSSGGTMWGLINDFRYYIISGTPANGLHGYGGLFCGAWGYPPEDMEAIRDLAKKLGYLGSYGEELQRHKERQMA